MIQRRSALSFAIMIIVISGLAGVLSRSDAQAATVNANIWVNPGGGYDYLNCGWHGRCTPDDETSGVGLDFKNAANDPVKFRSFGSRLSGSGSIGTGRALESDNTCYRVRVEILDGDGDFVASAIYVHTDTPQGGTFNINSGPLLSPATTTKTIGDTVPSEMSGCYITAPHLHQKGEDFASTNTSQYPSWVNAKSVTASLLVNWINSESYSYTE